MSSNLAEQNPLVESVDYILRNGAEDFYNKTLNFPLDDWQLFGIEAVLDVPRKQFGYPTKVNHDALTEISIVSCHGPGKTQWLAALSHVWMVCFPSLVPVTAPKQDQLKTRFMPRFRDAMRNAEKGYRNLVDAQTLAVRYKVDPDFPDWGLVMETGAEPENLQGYHATPQLFLVDEASSPRLEPMFPVIDGALSTPGSVLVTIGNPTRISGEFFNAHNKPQRIKHVFRIHVLPAEGVPKSVLQEVKSKIGVHLFKTKRVTKKWVQKFIDKYGLNSPITRVRAFGLFTASENNQLIHYEWLVNAREAGDDIEPDGSFPQLIISGDVADGGMDSSCVTAAIKYDSYTAMLKCRKFNFPPAESPILVADEMEKMFEEFKGDKGEDLMVPDSIGVGAGTAGILITRGYQVIRFIGGEKSSDPKRFRHRRAQGYIMLRDELRDGKMRYAPDFFESEEDWDDYFSQLISLKTRPGIERVEDIENKEDYKVREGESPDQADSTMQIFGCQGAPPIARGGNDSAEVVGESVNSGYDGGLAV